MGAPFWVHEERRRTPRQKPVPSSQLHAQELKNNPFRENPSLREFLQCYDNSYNRTKHETLFYEADEGGPRAFVPVVVRDGRKETDLTLDNASFELCRHETSLENEAEMTTGSGLN